MALVVAGPHMRYRPEQRLRRQRDFRAAREQGRRMECGGFTLWYRQRSVAIAVETSPGAPVRLPDPRDLYPGARVGIVASKAVVGCAVQRNRAKRRLREVFRAHQGLVPAGIDLILVARRSVNQVATAELAQRFVDACRRLFPAG